MAFAAPPQNRRASVSVHESPRQGIPVPSDPRQNSLQQQWDPSRSDLFVVLTASYMNAEISPRPLVAPIATALAGVSALPTESNTARVAYSCRLRPATRPQRAIRRRCLRASRSVLLKSTWTAARGSHRSRDWRARTPRGPPGASRAGAEARSRSARRLGARPRARSHPSTRAPRGEAPR